MLLPPPRLLQRLRQLVNIRLQLADFRAVVHQKLCEDLQKLRKKIENEKWS